MSEPHPRTLLKQLEQRARRRFGQHFLWRRDIVSRIVRGARVQEGDRVLEIGPGLGVLTRVLLDAGAQVTAVEVDRDLAAWVSETLPAVHLVVADALEVSWPECCPGSGWKVVANLPYNVGTPLVLRLLDHPDTFESITVMLQKEVVNRFLASPGNKVYGALTVQIAARARGRFLVAVPPTAFHPRPKVDSAVVQLMPYPEPDAGPAGVEAFDRVVRAAFAQRRKTVLNSLSSRYPRDRASAALSEAGIDPGLRAEVLDPDAFRALANALHGSRASQL